MPNHSPEGEIIDGLMADAEQALALGATAKAGAIYRGILAIDPDHVSALRQLAGITLHLGDPMGALELFQHAISHEPANADLYHGVGTALRLLNQPEQALLAFAGALRLDSAHAPTLYDRARLLQQQGKLEDAAKAYRKLAAVHNGHFDAIFNHAVVLYRQDNLLAAERWFHQAALIDPHDARPFINLGLIYRVWGFLPESIKCLEHAVHLAPEMAEAHWNLANALLVSGELVRGFAEAEWRFRRPGFPERPFGCPRWRGEDLAGRSILLAAEQGLGDVIHFARFAAPLAERGARVVIEAPQGLERLLATVPGIAGVAPWASPPAEIDFWIPLLSVPHVLGTTRDTLPAEVPYIQVPPDAARPPLPGSGLKVGLVWRGNPAHDNDRWRSLDLATLAPLLDVPGVEWFSLQVGAAREEYKDSAWRGRIKPLWPVLTDFANTAAVIDQLDLVITVDTAVAHLAGALGRPVWVLIAQGNDWRWFTDRTDSPWYPTLRLFRQQRPRRWGPALRDMTETLRNLVTTLPERGELRQAAGHE